MKVGDLKVGMMLTPSLNKYTNLKPVFQLREQLVSDGERDFYKCVVDVRHIRGFKDKTSVYDYGIYMGYKRSNVYLDGVKKHHMILVGGTLAYLTGYEFAYIEKVSEQVD
tara:strand:+ start:112 stop:441 length:330 start_codon:yes stop_codon:yes gene_type:complete